MNAEFESWAQNYKDFAENKMELLWPSETLVRLFKGSYISGKPLETRGKRVLDVGCGNANNLSFMATLGLELYGTEVHPDICKLVETRMEKLGYKANVKVGTNRELPFDDNTFDYLVSWNVLHYEKSEEAIIQSLKEFNRVLKPGGRFLLSTTGPEHMILKDAETLGNHRYRIGRSDDFRKGETYFYFDAPNYIQQFFSPIFQNVMVGRTHDKLFLDTLDWWIVTGTK